MLEESESKGFIKANYPAIRRQVMSEFRIPREALLEGAKACIENGLRLRRDAEVLFRNKGYSSAHVLAVFSFEEFGKSVLLSKKYFAGTGVTKDEYDKIFTKHPAKISFYLEQMADILPKKEDRELTIEFFKRMGEEEHKRKMKSIYVDWESGKWLSPRTMDEGEIQGQAFDAKKAASFMCFFAEEALKGIFPK